MTTTFAIYSSPIGDIYIRHHNNRLSMLHILGNEPTQRGVPDDFTDMVYGQVMEYLHGARKTFDIDLDISHCTPFQQDVLEALLQIPYGTTATYKDVATSIGNSKASRAVGMANNRNPIHVIIPCHRVVGSRGSLVGYAAGLDTKRLLLRLESQHV